MFFANNSLDKSSLELDNRKKELSDLITEVLRRQPHLRYFQGYHDICQVFLLVLGKDSAPAISRLSILRIRDYMLPSLAPALAQLRLLPSILNEADPILQGPKSGTRWPLKKTSQVVCGYCLG